MPLPVTRTNPPSRNNKKTDEQARIPVRLKKMSENIRCSADKDLSAPAKHALDSGKHYVFRNFFFLG